MNLDSDAGARAGGDVDHLLDSVFDQSSCLSK